MTPKNAEMIKYLKREFKKTNSTSCLWTIDGIEEADANAIEWVKEQIDKFFEIKRIHYGKPATILNKSLSYEMLILKEQLIENLENAQSQDKTGESRKVKVKK